MGLRHLYRLLLPSTAMTAKLPTFRKDWQFFIFQSKIILKSYYRIKYELIYS